MLTSEILKDEIKVITEMDGVSISEEDCEKLSKGLEPYINGYLTKK